MKYQNLMDMHTHSDNSFDGKQCCMLLCEKAVELGAAGIAITDHCEIDSKTEDFRALCSNQFVETYQCKRYFEGRLLVLQGIELGQAIYNKPLAEKILNNYIYDFVLGSIHNLPDTEDFYFLDYDQYDIQNLFMKYFEKILELCLWGEFDSLAHLNYPFRYISEEQAKRVDTKAFGEIIDAIFESLIKNSKALEINTSGLSMPMKQTLPGVEYIKRFKELGGEYITIGSDAHHSNNIFSGIEEGMDIAKSCGFTHMTIYYRHEPVLVPIK